MEPLTKKQIEAVVRWMKSWDILRNTAIPLRFAEHFTEELSRHRIEHLMYNRPPMGVKPKWLIDEQRKSDLSEAILRFVRAGYEVPTAWIIEYAHLINQAD